MWDQQEQSWEDVDCLRRIVCLAAKNGKFASCGRIGPIVHIYIDSDYQLIAEKT